MAFNVEEFQDLIRLLQERPEWRADLRRLVLTYELLALPELIRELMQAQQRTSIRIERLEEALIALTEGQQRTKARMGQMVEASWRGGYVRCATGRQTRQIAGEDRHHNAPRSNWHVGNTGRGSRRPSDQGLACH